MTNSKSAQLLDGLHKWWLDVRETEATKSPVSKDGTLESLKACVEGLKAELHPTLSTSELVAPCDVTNNRRGCQQDARTLARS